MQYSTDPQQYPDDHGQHGNGLGPPSQETGAGIASKLGSGLSAGLGLGIATDLSGTVTATNNLKRSRLPIPSQDPTQSLLSKRTRLPAAAAAAATDRQLEAWLQANLNQVPPGWPRASWNLQPGHDTLRRNLAGGPALEDSHFRQRQLLRQQRTTMQHIQHLQEEAAMRRQLQLLQQMQSNNISNVINLNMNMNSMTNHHTAPNQAFVSRERIHFQQLDDRNPDPTSNNSIPTTTSRRTSSTNLPPATPMMGPIAPPLPPPPFIPEANYRLPPVQATTRHYDQRLHLPLATEEDHNWLSEFQCFVRKELLQVFRASQQDVKVRIASKKVYYEQVGIRCKFCAHWKPNTRAIRSSAFPSSIRQLYQSFTMMLRDHCGTCPAIPPALKDRFWQLKRTNTQGASDSMRYWIYSASKLGMVDSGSGIVLTEHTQAVARNKPPFGTSLDSDGTADHPPRLLVKPDDLATGNIPREFLYTLLTQYQLIRLLPSECIGNRKSLRPGVPGLGCRYCCQAGRMGLSRVFPAKKKQLPSQIQDLYDHIRRCNLCPVEVKEELQQIKTLRDKKRVARDPSCPARTTDHDDSDEDRGFVDLLWLRLGHRGELATPIMIT